MTATNEPARCAIWRDADPRNIDAHLSRLRRKLGSAAAVVTTVGDMATGFEPEAGT